VALESFRHDRNIEYRRLPLSRDHPEPVAFLRKRISG
jgi:hypothetical protein